ncbi:rCG34541, isoform CRA_d [Rattus norvegicus]|uniref:RCG34541, isoform CRA_d n=1 Tax=Rattus norvegicus TaxID=10116 RepID=A6HLN5_RAT|nr:rCG34541, isoform CRA_d [Rattus norvegicus]
MPKTKRGDLSSSSSFFPGWVGRAFHSCCATTVLGSQTKLSEKEQGSQQHSDFSESSVARHSASIVAFREAPDHQGCPS